MIASTDRSLSDLRVERQIRQLEERSYYDYFLLARPGPLCNRATICAAVRLSSKPIGWICYCFGSLKGGNGCAEVCAEAREQQSEMTDAHSVPIL